MRSLSSLVLLAAVALAGCRSSDASDGSAATGSVPCTCGDPVTDMQGCAHALCMRGQRNPENPDCVCGTLTIPK